MEFEPTIYAACEVRRAGRCRGADEPGLCECRTRMQRMQWDTSLEICCRAPLDSANSAAMRSMSWMAIGCHLGPMHMSRIQGIMLRADLNLMRLLGTPP